VYAPNGDILKVNDVCHNAALARTLEAVAVGGPDAFYRGPVADHLVKDMREAGGIMTREDLEKYQVKVRRPLTESVMGLTVLSMPPPSAGGAGLMLVSN
jgi:gamma-glutamyltranspeptidase/glutathione hydrolase/leukotriene-C4 hydrolase